MKKAISLILAFVMCLSLCACSGETPKGTPKELMEAVCVSHGLENIEITHTYLDKYGDYKWFETEIRCDGFSKIPTEETEALFKSIAYSCDSFMTDKNEFYYIGNISIHSDGHTYTYGSEKNGGIEIYTIYCDGEVYAQREFDKAAQEKMLQQVQENIDVAASGLDSNSNEDGYGHDRYDAIVIAEKIVKSELKAPSTAEFCSNSEYTVSCVGNTWTVKGYVDAQNSLGATLRNNFTVKFTFSSSNEYTIDSCSIT